MTADLYYLYDLMGRRQGLSGERLAIYSNLTNISTTSMTKRVAVAYSITHELSFKKWENKKIEKGKSPLISNGLDG